MITSNELNERKLTRNLMMFFSFSTKEKNKSGYLRLIITRNKQQILSDNRAPVKEHEIPSIEQQLKHVYKARFHRPRYLRMPTCISSKRRFIPLFSHYLFFTHFSLLLPVVLINDQRSSFWRASQSTRGEK